MESDLGDLRTELLLWVQIETADRLTTATKHLTD